MVAEYIKKMYKEDTELSDKIFKAERGLKTLDLDKIEKELLISQVQKMKAYEEVLQARIKYAIEKGKK